MFRNLSVIFKVGNVWGRIVSGAKYPGANCSGLNVTEAKKPGDEMSPGRSTGDETLGNETSGSHLG